LVGQIQKSVLERSTTAARVHNCSCGGYVVVGTRTWFHVGWLAIDGERLVGLTLVDIIVTATYLMLAPVQSLLHQFSGALVGSGICGLIVGNVLLDSLCLVIVATHKIVCHKDLVAFSVVGFVLARVDTLI